VPCIQYALEFKHVLYQQGARQDMFVHTFMTTLNIDEKTRNWLDTQAKRWSPDISAAWKKFSAHHSPLAPPTFFERIELSWERRAAFRQIKAAIQHRASQRKEGSDS